MFRQGPPRQAPPRGAGPQASGQWVYTAQHGWLWMPHGAAYTYVGPNATTPYAYVYGPGLGWRWMAAPWVWGWGPRPYFGNLGPYRYGWYGSYWRYPHRGYWGGYRGYWGGYRGYWGGYRGWRWRR